jgi:hypothetical protein
MGKQFKGNGGGTSRVRFVLFDAEVPDGEMGSLMQTIQNALRMPTPVPIVQRIAAAPKAVAEEPPPGEQSAEVVEDAEFEETAHQPVARARAQRKPPKTPNVVEMDMKSDVSLAEFANGKDAGSHHKRYMIAATWLKEHRGIDAVTADHIYTCYKSMNWPANVPDFAQPLRELKSAKLFGQPGKGLYAINHIGVEKVKSLGGG